ncbi:hypothetical protein LUZ60_005963 [Juncus effusus]|nr:hypothetical protein LUZ60_005963 [Juncus effusus]
MEFPTICYEEALAKEIEYKKRLKMIRFEGSYHTTLMESSEEPRPLQSITNPFSQTQTQTQTQIQTQIQSQTQIQIQINSDFRTQTQTRSYPSITQRQIQPISRHRQMRRRQVPPHHSLTPYMQMQISRPAQPLSYWCKLCKIDCTNEHNFRIHIGGRKHQASKLAVTQGRNRAFGTGESSGNQNRRSQNQIENQDNVESSIESNVLIDLTNDD